MPRRVLIVGAGLAGTAAPRRSAPRASTAPSPSSARNPTSPTSGRRSRRSSWPGSGPSSTCSRRLAGRTVLPDVYACGDVAVLWHPTLARHVRLEHWTSAVSQAAAAARTILDREPGATPTPYFRSDQFGLRLQHVGFPQEWAHVVLDGKEDSLTAGYLAADVRLVAALLVNRPHQVARFRRQLAPELLAA